MDPMAMTVDDVNASALRHPSRYPAGPDRDLKPGSDMCLHLVPAWDEELPEPLSDPTCRIVMPHPWATHWSGELAGTITPEPEQLLVISDRLIAATLHERRVGSPAVTLRYLDGDGE